MVERIKDTVSNKPVMSVVIATIITNLVGYLVIAITIGMYVGRMDQRLCAVEDWKKSRDASQLSERLIKTETCFDLLSKTVNATAKDVAEIKEAMNRHLGERLSPK